jgi:hypothetical protein
MKNGERDCQCRPANRRPVFGSRLRARLSMWPGTRLAEVAIVVPPPAVNTCRIDGFSLVASLRAAAGRTNMSSGYRRCCGIDVHKKIPYRLLIPEITSARPHLLTRTGAKRLARNAQNTWINPKRFPVTFLQSQSVAFPYIGNG